MSVPPTAVALGDLLRDWRPPAQETVRRVDLGQAAAFAALLDVPSPVRREGDPLPPMWHAFTLVDVVAQRDLGEDGHPMKGAFMPPIPARRRMFAGGRLRQWEAIAVGAELTSRASLADVTVRNGRSGDMAFVTVREQLYADGQHVATEEKDIVYRSEPDGGAPHRVGPPPPTASVFGESALSMTADPVVLFRFSALTYNAHRIHYDLPYATTVEGYPGLVVHGPLLALLALELPRVQRPDAAVRSFAYRLVRPAFAPVRLDAVGRATDEGLEVVVGAHGCEPSLTATVLFDDEPRGGSA